MSDLKSWVDLSQIVSAAAQVVASVALLVTLALYWRLWKTAEAQLQAFAKQTRLSARAQAWHDFFVDFDKINSLPTVQNPYPNLKSGVDATGLLHHLNLIFRFHVNRAILEPEECEGFERWLDRVFFKWVAGSPTLCSDLQRFVLGGDLYPESFLVWLKGQAGYQRVLNAIREA